MALRTLQIRTRGGSYPIWIGAGARKELPRLLALKRSPSRLHLITDSSVGAHHGAAVRGILRRAGRVSTTVIPSGEKSKSVGVLTKVWRELLRAGCDREACVVALGGGVVGDLAGFAAASLLRGVDFLQVPTTLLAMVDASVGGKTGINLPEGKNLVGAFQQPRGVIVDLDFLRTLPPRDFRAGWAEVIKTAAIRDARLFLDLGRERAELLAGSPAKLCRVVERCCRIKADVVRTDEKESGLRRILNFGHTLGHALESVQRYGGLLHGEAVAIGMVFAAKLGEKLGHTREGTAARLRSLLEAYGLPTAMPRARWSGLLEAMRHDKKRGRRGIRWVFLQHIGGTKIVDGVPIDVVKKALFSFQSQAKSRGGGRSSS